MFLSGAGVPFLPGLWLLLQSPSAVWMNVQEYRVHNQMAQWPDPLIRDLRIMTNWLADPQSLLLGLLAVTGVFYIARRSAWPPERRSEFYLCGWLALGIAIELAIAQPTLSAYFCLLTPFAAILAIPGLYALVGAHTAQAERPLWPVLVLCLIFAGALARGICDTPADSYAWNDYEAVAQKVLEVTPPGGQIFTEEKVYFLTRRRPPSGMEFGYSHELVLPPAELARLHITSVEMQGRQLDAGAFASAAYCDMITKYPLDVAFRQNASVDGCVVYWTPAAPVDKSPENWSGLAHDGSIHASKIQ
jgi:hypothetical protein